MRTLENSEDPDEIPHHAKLPQRKKYKNKLEIVTSDPSIYMYMSPLHPLLAGIYNYL